MIEYTVTVYSDGDKFWYNEDGLLHREDGPAIEKSNGDKHWFINGKLHREDGPAIEWNDEIKVWYINGKRHREDGPAVELINGYKTFYINGENLTEEEFNKRTQIKKLTVAEISDFLGYDVEIIKE